MPNFITFWLVVLSQALQVSVRQAADLMDPNDHKIGKALQEGWQGGFAPIRRLCQTLYHNCGKMANMLQGQDEMLRPLLITFQSGIDSNDAETSASCSRCLRNLFKQIMSHHHQHILWLWFTADAGGLEACVRTILNRPDQSSRQAALILIAQLCINEGRASALLRQHLHEKVPLAADYMLMTHDIVLQLDKNPPSSGGSLLSLESIRHIVNYAFRHAQSRAGRAPPQNRSRDPDFDVREAEADRSYNRGRCAALCLLSDLWLMMDSRGQQEETVMKAILGLIKKAARDRRAVDVQITANTCLFNLLETFVQGQRQSAPYVYKTLIFSLIESFQDDETLREYMLATMTNCIRSLVHLPVAVLVEPLIKQADMEGYTASELNLLSVSMDHPRLSAQNALSLLEMFAKIALNDQIYSQMVTQAIVRGVKRFSTIIQIQNFSIAFIKFALDELLSSEAKVASAFDDGKNTLLSVQYEDIDEGMEHALRRVFYELDMNGNNMIEKRELLRALRDGLPSLFRAVEKFPRLKPILTPSSYDATYMLMQTKNENKVSYDEFKRFCIQISRQGSGNSGLDSSSGFGNDSAAAEGRLKRSVFLSVLKRMVELRDRHINANAERLFADAVEKYRQMNVTMTNLKNSQNPSSYLDENAVLDMNEVTDALESFLSMCRSTTPPSAHNLSDSIHALAELPEDSAWKGANIDDVEQQYLAAKNSGHLVTEPSAVVDKERPESPLDPDIVVLAKTLKEFHSILQFRRPNLQSFKEGDLDENEFRRQVNIALGMKMSKKQAKMAFAWFDTDGGGTLDSQEVLKSFFDTGPMENFVKDVTARFPMEMKRPLKMVHKPKPKRSAGPQATPNSVKFRDPFLSMGLTKIQDALTLRRPNLDVFKGTKLDREDFRRDLMHALGLKMPLNEVDAVFDYIDDDGSGELDYVEIIRKFFDKKNTGKLNNAPTLLHRYKGTIGRTLDFGEDSENSEDETVDEQVLAQVERALPVALRGDSFEAVTLRKIKAALDKGEEDSDLGDQMRAFKGRNLTKAMFKSQCKRILNLVLSDEELKVCFNYIDEDGGGTIEYEELMRGLCGPLHSALTRIKQVLDDDRMQRDMRSFQGRDLDKEEFWYQTKVVLGVLLSKDELNAVFDYFDADGGGTITYDEILFKFHRREHLDLGKAGRKKATRTFRSGIEYNKINIERVDRRRKRELERRRLREERRKLRSDKIRSNLRAQFEEKLENRIALGRRSPRVPIITQQESLIGLHETQPKALRQNTNDMLRKSMKDIQMSRIKARPPTPPQKPMLYINAEELLSEWTTCLQFVFKVYVKYQLSFAKTKKFDFDDLSKSKSTIDETSWLRMMTDFCIVPQLLSKYDAKGIFHRSNLTLSPNAADTSIVVQDRPVGQKGPMQYRLIDFNDFLAAIVGVAHSRASFFACHASSREKCDALMSHMRDTSILVNTTKEITAYYNKKKVVSGSVDIDNYLSHGLDAPSYVWRLRRTWGDERAENTQRNAWLHLSTPTFSYEWRYSGIFRKCLPECVWIATELLDNILNAAISNLHILQSVKIDSYHDDEKKSVTELCGTMLQKDKVIDPNQDEFRRYTIKATKSYMKKNGSYRLYKGKTPKELYGEDIPVNDTVEGKEWVPMSTLTQNFAVPKFVDRLHQDPKHDKLREMSTAKLERLATIERTKGARTNRSGLGFGATEYFDNRSPMDEEGIKKWESHASLRKQHFNRDARVDRLAFLGEKARSEMTMGRQVTARWATEIIVRIADECTTGEAQDRLSEKCDYDPSREVPIDRWVAKYMLSRRKGEHLVGLPRYPKDHPMKTLVAPPVPKLNHNAVETAAAVKLRNDVKSIKREKMRELKRKKRQKELRAELERAKSNRKIADVNKMVEDASFHHAENARKYAEADARKEADEHNKIEIAIYRSERLEREQAERKNRKFIEDVEHRNYSMHVINTRKYVKTVSGPGDTYKAKRISPRKSHSAADDHSGFNIEELNERRRESKKRRARAVKAMEKAKAKEKEELEKMEEKLRMADNPVDKLSLKLSIALRKNSKKLSDIFATIDVDGSGTVTYKEFRRGLYDVGIKLNTKEATELCTALDKDGDGDVSYLELKRFMDNSKNNEQAAAAAIQARWRGKRINMKTKAQLKQEYQAKVLEEQNKRLQQREKRWKEDMKDVDHILKGEDEYDHRGRRIKKGPSPKKTGVPRQPKSPKSPSVKSDGLGESTRSAKIVQPLETSQSEPSLSQSNKSLAESQNVKDSLEESTETKWDAKEGFEKPPSDEDVAWG